MRAPPHARSSTGGASTTTSRARRGASANPCFVALTLGERPKLGAKPPDLHSQACAMRFVGVLCTECPPDERVPRQSPGHASPSARASANNTGRRGERDHRVVRHARHDGTRPRRAPPTPAPLQPPQAGGVAPRHAQSGAPRACSGRGMRFLPPPSVQGYLPGARHARPERAQRAPPWSAGAALRSPQRPVRGRPSTRAGKAPDRARRAHARPRRDARSGEGAGSRDAAHARRSPGRRVFRASPAPRRAPSRGQLRSRDTSAISASATTHLARATASLGPKARAALCRRAFARTKSPSCAIAIPRSARAGASSRRRNPLQYAEEVTRGERPRRSRDQRVHRNPVTLVTPTVSMPGAKCSRTTDSIEKRMDSRRKEPKR